jgi:cytochrome c oxidase assembly protein subunit 15
LRNNTMSTPQQGESEKKERRERWVKRLAVAATIGMFIVLMMGSTVTSTGSGEGCGRSWPLCQGKFIPSYAVETAIEFSHRLVTAVEGLLIAATAIGAVLIRRGSREVRIYVAVMVGTLLLQSGLGAAAVMWPQSPQIMAAHFGISMTCFAAVFLLTRLLYEDPEREDPLVAESRAHPLPSWFHRGAWAMLVGSIVVAYVGAYMRHSGNEMACYEWPRCDTGFVPDMASPGGIAFTHRILALTLMTLVYLLTWAIWKMQPHYRSILVILAGASITITMQALAGGAVVLTRLDIWATLAHASLMAWFFVFVTDTCRQVLKTRKSPGHPQSVLIPHPSGSPGAD